jgi:hypothetical protein
MGDLVESFWLYGKDGSKHRAYIHQERVSTSSLNGPAGSMLGQKTARLANGPNLDFVDENTFKNAKTGELLSRSKP